MSELTIHWQANSGIKRTVKVPLQRGAALLSSKLDAPSLVPYPVAVAIEDGWIICVPASGSEGEIEQANQKTPLADFSRRLVWVAKNVPPGKPNEIEVFRFKFAATVKSAHLKVPGGQLTISHAAAAASPPVAAEKASQQPLQVAPVSPTSPPVVAPAQVANPVAPAGQEPEPRPNASVLDDKSSESAANAAAASAINDNVGQDSQPEIALAIEFASEDALGVLAEDFEPAGARRRALIFKVLLALVVVVGLWFMFKPSAKTPPPFANPFDEPPAANQPTPVEPPTPPAPVVIAEVAPAAPAPTKPEAKPTASKPAESKPAVAKPAPAPEAKPAAPPPPTKKPTGVRVEAGKFTADGALAKAEIAAFVDKNLRGLTSCYEDGLKSQPDLQGTVTVAFKILPDGRVSQQEIQNTTLRSDSVESCALKRIRRWIFPKPKSGSVAVVFPFVFATGK